MDSSILKSQIIAQSNKINRGKFKLETLEHKRSITKDPDRLANVEFEIQTLKEKLATWEQTHERNVALYKNIKERRRDSRKEKIKNSEFKLESLKLRAGVLSQMIKREQEILAELKTAPLDKEEEFA